MLTLTFAGENRHNTVNQVAASYRSKGFVVKFDRNAWKLTITSRNGSPVPSLFELAGHTIED